MRADGKHEHAITPNGVEKYNFREMAAAAAGEGEASENGGRRGQAAPCTAARGEAAPATKNKRDSEESDVVPLPIVFKAAKCPKNYEIISVFPEKFCDGQSCLNFCILFCWPSFGWEMGLLKKCWKKETDAGFTYSVLFFESGDERPVQLKEKEFVGTLEEARGKADSAWMLLKKIVHECE